MGQAQATLPVKLVDYLAEGCIGYPAGQVPALHIALASHQKPDVQVAKAAQATSVADSSVMVTAGEGV